MKHEARVGMVRDSISRHYHRAWAACTCRWRNITWVDIFTAHLLYKHWHLKHTVSRSKAFHAYTSLPLGLIPRLSPSLLSLQLYQHCKWQKVRWGTGDEGNIHSNDRLYWVWMPAALFFIFIFLHRVLGAIAGKFKTVLLWCYSAGNRMSSVSHPHTDWWQGCWTATQELRFAGGDQFQP